MLTATLLGLALSLPSLLAYVGAAYLALNGAPVFQAFAQPEPMTRGHGLAAAIGLGLLAALALGRRSR